MKKGKHMIEHISRIDCFQDDLIRSYLNNIIEKQNEIIGVINAQQESKPKRVLCVNNECAVVEFCCDVLESKIEEYEIAWYMHKERGKVFIVRPKGYAFSGHEYCPFCHASIALYKAQQWQEVQITLKIKDAEELSAILSECLKKVAAKCEEYPYKTGRYYDEDYERMLLIMRGITALNMHKEVDR